MSSARSYARYLTESSVNRRDQPFELRGGGVSNFYADLRVGLADGLRLHEAPRFMVQASGIVDKILRREVEFDEAGLVVAGIGVAGRALATAHAMRRNDLFPNWAHGNDNRNDHDTLNGYGFHGAAVAGRRVFGVDEIATTGNSLVTLASMLKEFGATTVGMAVLVDRSGGQTAAAMAEHNIPYSAAFVFNEDTGLITPTEAVVERTHLEAC